MELCIGFCENTEDDDSPISQSSYSPCLVFLIRSDPCKLPPYLYNSFHDGFLLVSSSGEHESSEYWSLFISSLSNPILLTLHPIQGDDGKWNGPENYFTQEQTFEYFKEIISHVMVSWSGVMK